MNIAVDITMCTNHQCDKRELCFRAEESGMIPNPTTQSWYEFNPENKKRCQYYGAKKKL